MGRERTVNAMRGVMLVTYFECAQSSWLRRDAVETQRRIHRRCELLPVPVAGAVVAGRVQVPSHGVHSSSCSRAECTAAKRPGVLRLHALVSNRGSGVHRYEK